MATIYMHFCPVSSFFFLSFVFPRLISAVAEWMSTILRHMMWPSANIECRSKMCCTRLAGNAGPKNRQNFAICAPSHNFIGLYLRNGGTYRQSEKNLLNSNISPTTSHNMVNFGPLSAEIRWVGHPSKFEPVSRLGSVTARHSSSGRQPNFAALNRGRHLYSARRRTSWALAHISS